MREKTLVQIGALRKNIARTEGAMREVAKGIDRTVCAGRNPGTFRDYLLALGIVALQEIYLWWLARRRAAMRAKLYETRRRAAQEQTEDLIRGHEAEREERRRVRGAAQNLSRRHGGRPARICGREPETPEELRLVEDFLRGAEERHLICLEAWRRSDGDNSYQEKVRVRLERDLPLRRYERRKATPKPASGVG